MSMSKARFTLYTSTADERIRELEDLVARLRKALAFEAAWHHKMGHRWEEARIHRVLDQ